MNKKQRHAQGLMYAAAYVAWVQAIRWQTEPDDWYERTLDIRPFGRTVGDVVGGIVPRRDKKDMWLRYYLSVQLAEAMCASSFREVFQFDRMLKVLSDQARG